MGVPWDIEKSIERSYIFVSSFENNIYVVRLYIHIYIFSFIYRYIVCNHNHFHRNVEMGLWIAK